VFEKAAHDNAFNGVRKIASKYQKIRLISEADYFKKSAMNIRRIFLNSSELILLGAHPSGWKR
jgi:hypothetical protein